MKMHAREILEACLYVDDLAAARRFYTQVLGLTVVDEQPGRHLFMRCGARMLLLFLPEASSVPGILPMHGAQGTGHLAFAATEEEIAAWREHFTTQGVEIEQEVQWPERGTSLYFRDPANNCLEIATPRLWGLDAAQTL